MRPSMRTPTRLLPAGLLVLAIVTHGIAIEVRDEDPQRGSAFAMFATADIGATRRVLATVPGEPEIDLVVPEAFGQVVTHLRDAPSDAAARRLGDLLLASTWEVGGDTASVGDGMIFDRVRVRVVGLTVDGREVSRRIITDVVVAGGES